MMASLKRLAKGVLDIVYTKRAECMGCGIQAGFERDWLCEDCRRELANRWLGAAQPPEGGLIDGAAFAYRYGGPASGVVQRLKYYGARCLSEPMGGAMVTAFEAIAPAPADCAVSVPMHAKRLRERGYNHAALLAEQAAERLGLTVLDALERIRDTRQQARLSEAERLLNLENAIVPKRDITGLRVLLVDDVCTTGATANACAAALRQAGAAAVYLLCFARAGKEKD